MAPLNSGFPLLICSTELVLSLGIMSMSNLQRLLHAISKAVRGGMGGGGSAAFFRPNYLRCLGIRNSAGFLPLAGDGSLLVFAILNR